MGIKPDEKSQLAVEICDVSSRATACALVHRHGSTFIDWYLVLRVDENAEIDAIRKQYHKLALQLHPDKNKHSKAEAAFKLVSEAYFCLLNNARRAAFDSERSNNIPCTKCSRIPHPATNPPTGANLKIQTPPYHGTSRSGRTQKRMRELRNKLRDEVMIIQKCLASSGTREPVGTNGTRKEIPIFNPSDYRYEGYPQHRTINLRKLDSLGAGFTIGNKCLHSTVKNESPIFQYRSERASFMSRCATARNH